MSTADAFLPAIRTNPEDDTARLVFADWLDENNDPERAEFIRVQIELARITGTGDASRWQELYDRANDLLDANRERWLRGLPKDCREKVAFERGFVARASTTGKRFLRWAEKLKARTPLTAVDLTETSQVFTALTTRPVFAGIRELVFTPQRDVEWTLLAKCRHLASLRSLKFRFMSGSTPAMLGILMRSATLPALRKFGLHYCHLTALAPAHLEGSVVLGNLTHLDFWQCRLGAAQWEMLLGAPHGMRAPEQLDLPQCGVGPDELAAITRCPNLRTLRKLTLNCNKSGIEGVKALAGCKPFGNLRSLDLSAFVAPGESGDAGAVALARSRTLPSLESLGLSANGITDEGARAFLGAKRLRNLRHLSLCRNPNVSEATLAKLRTRYEVEWIVEAP